MLAVAGRRASRRSPERANAIVECHLRAARAGTPPPAHTDPAPSFLPQNVLGLALVALLFVYHFIVSPPLAP